MATRFYGVATSSVSGFSRTPDAGWQSTTGFVTRGLSTGKASGTEQLSNVNVTSGANNECLAFQLVSPPLNPGSISGTITVMSRGREVSGNDNIDRRSLCVRLVSSDGSTVRGTLLVQGFYAETTELPATVQGVRCANAQSLTSQTAQQDDRLVVEVGYGMAATGTSPQFDMAIGGNGTDHTNAATDTTGTVPWFEFSQNLSFAPIALSATCDAVSDTQATLTVAGPPNGPTRIFDGVDDNLQFSMGNLAGWTYGTVAMLMKLTETATVKTAFCVTNSDDLYKFTPLQIETGEWIVWHNGSAGAASTNTIPTGVWALVVVRKATGTATPRASIYNYNTATWSHANFDASVANWTATVGGAGGDFITLSTGGASEIFNGKLAVVAVWENSLPYTADSTGDSNLVAAGLEDTLQKWVDASPSSLWSYHQAAVTTAVADIIGTAEQATRVGTTVDADDGPYPFDWNLGGGGAVDLGSVNVDGVSDTQAILALALPLSATSDAVSDVQATARLALPLTATVDAVADQQATISTGTQHALQATVDAVTDVVATARLALPLTAQIDAVADQQATLRRYITSTILVADGLDDGVESGGVGSANIPDWSNVSALAMGAAGGGRAAWRFNGWNIPQGGDILSAVLKVTLASTDKNDAEGTLKGHLTENSWTGTAGLDEDIWGRAATTASVSWTTNDLGSLGTEVSSPEIKTIVQEIVNQSGWRPGYSLMIFYEHPGTTEQFMIVSYENTTYAEPRLVVTHEPGSLQTISATSDAVAEHLAGLGGQAHALTATVDAVAEHTGTLAFIHPLAATVDAVSDVQATAKLSLPLAATADAVAEQSATLALALPLSATSDAVASQTVTLGLALPLTATSDAVAEHQATLATVLPMSATVDVVAEHLATLALALPLASTSDAVADQQATLRLALPLAATVDTVADHVANLLLGGQVDLSATLDAVADHLAALRLTLACTATSDVVADLTASLGLSLPLTVTSDAVAAQAASLGLALPLTATSDAVAEHLASAGVSYGVSANVDAVAEHLATARLALALSATSDAVAEHLATARLAIALSATSDVVADQLADLFVLGTTMQATVDSVADVQSQLGLQIPLTSTVDAVAEHLSTLRLTQGMVAQVDVVMDLLATARLNLGLAATTDAVVDLIQSTLGLGTTLAVSATSDAVVDVLADLLVTMPGLLQVLVHSLRRKTDANDLRRTHGVNGLTKPVMAGELRRRYDADELRRRFESDDLRRVPWA